MRTPLAAASAAVVATLLLAASGPAGGKVVASGTAELPGRTGWGDFATVSLGRVDLPVGDCEFVVKARRKNGDSFINLRSVRMAPVK
jgi:hypothetical protein